MKIDEDSLTCPIHYGILKDPCECDECKNNFCKECVNDFLKKRNECPLCKCSPFSYRENISLGRIVNEIKFICQNCGKSFKNEDEFNTHVENCIIEKYKCVICEKEFNENNFFNHIIKSHKNDIISIFNQNSMINKMKNIDDKNKMNLGLSSFNFKNKEENQKKIFDKAKKNIESQIKIDEIGRKKSVQINDINMFPNQNKTNQIQTEIKTYTNTGNNDFENDYNVPISRGNGSGPINFNNLTNNNNVNNYNNNRINDFFDNVPPLTVRSNNNRMSLSSKNVIPSNYNVTYCNKINLSIPCKCCSDHICKIGNCMCKKCMLINIKELKLKNYQLINKKGKICNYERGTYFCGQTFMDVVVNISQKVFTNKIICNSNHPCPDCKILTSLKFFYLKE